MISSECSTNTYAPVPEQVTLPPAGTADGTDDSASWLITLADLMTILLVFSFVLFITSHRNRSSTNPAPEAAPHETPSLVTVAHANTAQQPLDPAVPLFLDDDTSTPDLSAEPVITIMKHVIHFESTDLQLQESDKVRLCSLADLSRKNPSSRFIIRADMSSSSDLPLKRALHITDFLVRSCAVENKNIFFQAPPDAASRPAWPVQPATAEELPLEVQLVKAFWWF